MIQVKIVHILLLIFVNTNKVTHEEESYSNDYIDLSQQMVQQVNNGAFDKNQQNENVNVTYFS